MYGVVCDNCNKGCIDEDNGFVAWSDESSAKDNAIDSEWIEENEKHYCPDCFEYDDDDNLILKPIEA